MADEFKLHRQADRAARAKTLLENELLQEAFAGIEAGLLETFKVSELTDDAGRLRARIALGILENMKAQLSKMIADGNYAGKELLRLEKESTLKRMLKRA